MTSNTANKAEEEIEILFKLSTDPDNRPIIEPFKDEILALVDAFGNSGQSGGSAPYTAGAISEAVKTLCMQQPLCPITGIDEEWVEIGSNIFQNNRCPAIFKDGTGRPHYLDAITWRTDSGSGWHSSALLPDGNEVTSRQYIKSFPFTPKTFYIDVREEEVTPGGWELYIKDINQLDEVFEYYDEFLG